MRRAHLPTLVGIIVLALLALYVVWPQSPESYLPAGIPWPKSQGIHIRLGDFQFDRQSMRLGLDLQGGTHIILKADLSKISAGERSNAMQGVVNIMTRRIDAYGVAESQIQIQGEDRVSVQLPGVRNIDEALRLIGKTAQLDFREQVIKDDGASEWQIAKAKGLDGQEKELTGKYFKPNAAVAFDPQSGRPEVAFEFDAEGAQLFEQITQRLIGRPLGIFLDNELISAPTVQAVIRDRGVITGVPLEEARTLAIQLNAGALPVPVEVIKQSDVDATLGADSIRKSIIAGEIALGIIILFMLAYYRLPGIVASGALLVYVVWTLAIFKLLPVTLTLAGIAAFILSVGMAVDASILIFERMKEEIRSGRTFGAALATGSARAMSAIRDSNVSTLITCGILYWFGSNFGASIVMGFALTLALGVVISFITATFVTRTFLGLFTGSRLVEHPWLLGLEREEAMTLVRPQQRPTRLGAPS
ncbi:MAG: protein translocase subunit SecD [Chloroflexi bacterium]|nr:protein translocase subunit SecD [Chloroflexota bacterium]